MSILIRFFYLLEGMSKNVRILYTIWRFLSDYVQILYITNQKGSGFISEHIEFQSPQKLKGDSANYFMIPASLILDTDIDNKRIALFSYFSMRRGLDRAVIFSINSLAQWMGRKPNRNPNGINNKIIEMLKYLQDKEFVNIPNRTENASAIMEAYFDTERICLLCQKEYFAIIYCDEIRKIINYKSIISDDANYNIDITLLVFSYLRMAIPKRKNKLSPEEVNIDGTNNHTKDIESRRKEFPEAYDTFYMDIAEKLGISERQVSNAVSALNELGLIYHEALPRTKDEEDNWHTHTTIFCNYYKREKSDLLDFGEPYYKREAENKREKIKKFFKKGKK